MAKTKTTYCEKKSTNDEAIEYEDVYVNGKEFHIRKGENVEVPAVVADIIEESRKNEREINKKVNLEFDNV